MNTLAIDIGGTKLAVALFSGADTASPQILRREIRPTDRSGGPSAMLAQIADITRRWSDSDKRGNDSDSINVCGIGFGGPVNFAEQRVALSTHVEGWGDFPLVERLREMLRIPIVMDNDANCGALGEKRSVWCRTRRAAAAFLHDAFHRDRRRHRPRRRSTPARPRFVCRRDRPPSPFGPMVPNACAARADVWSGCAADCGWNETTWETARTRAIQRSGSL